MNERQQRLHDTRSGDRCSRDVTRVELTSVRSFCQLK